VKYDYIVTSTPLDGGREITERGTVEAPDARAACLVAFVQAHVNDNPPAWPSDTDHLASAARFLMDADYHAEAPDAEIIESWRDAWAADDPDWSDTQEFEPLEDDPVGCYLYNGDYQYEVGIYPHDPERFRRPTGVVLTVYLNVRQTGEPCTYSDMKRHAENLVQHLLREGLPHDHPSRDKGLVLEVTEVSG
jgi:hypothetical protein